ncbi:MAG: hypothetical protein A3D28_02300 [Omnitrophica bacterium RIFCSPHIGHO2_02_FULL_63_14]|nr:MAG: hypothetical protein A3D28_02300 [Omnitrophica bacterium RIFCSPHIGHO2_02_FULL_63_14]
MKTRAKEGGFILLVSILIIIALFLLTTTALLRSSVGQRIQREGMTRLRWTAHAKAMSGMAEVTYRVSKNDTTGLPSGSFTNPLYAPTFWLDLDANVPHTSRQAADDVRVSVQARDINGQRLIKVASLT